ncbi:MAG: hypothetical protein ACLQVL_17265 [Terriglobia bacterium]
MTSRLVWRIERRPLLVTPLRKIELAFKRSMRHFPPRLLRAEAQDYLGTHVSYEKYWDTPH